MQSAFIFGHGEKITDEKPPLGLCIQDDLNHNSTFKEIVSLNHDGEAQTSFLGSRNHA